MAPNETWITSDWKVMGSGVKDITGIDSWGPYVLVKVIFILDQNSSGELIFPHILTLAI